MKLVAGARRDTARFSVMKSNFEAWSAWLLEYFRSLYTLNSVSPNIAIADARAFNLQVIVNFQKKKNKKNYEAIKENQRELHLNILFDQEPSEI